MQVPEMLHSLFNIEWWRVVWIPIVGLILTWLTTRGKNAADLAAARDGNVQGREDKLFARYTAEIAKLEKIEAALRDERDGKDVEISRFREYAGNLRHLLRDARQKAESLLRQVPVDHRPVDELSWDPIPRSPDADNDDSDDEPSRGGSPA